MIEVPTFTTPQERSDWVQMKLRAKASNFSAIATRLGKDRSTVSDAMYKANDLIEREIATEVGVTQIELFPERFDSEGRRLHLVKNKRLMPQRNVKTGRAA